MTTMFKKIALGSALAATAMSTVVATPAAAQGWHGDYHRGGGNGAGVAIAAGVLGLAVGAVLASNAHHHAAPAPVAYAPPADCYDGYDGSCYPAEDYYRMGWSWREGSWYNRDGQRFAQPFTGRGGPDGDWRGGDRGGGRGEPGRGSAPGGYDRHGSDGRGQEGFADRGGWGGDRGRGGGEPGPDGRR